MRTPLFGLLSLLAGAALVGCDGSSWSFETFPPPDEGALRLATSAGELEASIKSGFTTVTAPPGEAFALATNDAGASGFTLTYTQEPNVDEFDAVRYDGEHLYIAPRRYLNCCFILAAAPDDAVNAGEPAEASIRILSTDPDGASAAVVSRIELDEETSIQGMYVEGDTLFALTAGAVYGPFGSSWTRPEIWAPEYLGYRVYDVSDRTAPVLETDVSIQGVFVESRRIGDTVYIISRYAPGIPGLIYSPQTAADVATNEAILAEVSLDDLLPSITIDGVTEDLVDPTSCYITNDERVAGYPVVTNVTAVPVDDPKAYTNTCYNDDVYGAYVSETAIYFPQVVGYVAPSTVDSRIHKFELSNRRAVYRGSGDIDGQVWRGGQADFRMSEYNGDLRVMATQYTANNADFVDHKLYILREAQGRTALDVVADLPNAARPEPIGKPNEALYGVRFLGDRLYAVTFEQIDPLYAIDLSDPTDPRIAGELTVTGFSDFLHPVNEDLLLGLGSAATGAIKIELFDVSDIASPLSRGSVILGDPGSYSEAVYNRHAFTYQSDVNGVDRFLIPADLYESTNGGGIYRSTLNLFEIHDKATPGLATLVPQGRIEPDLGDAAPWGVRHRSFIHDDTVFWIREDEVYSAFWLSPTLVNGPF